jgi:hypothetical protein
LTKNNLFLDRIDVAEVIKIEGTKITYDFLRDLAKKAEVKIV